MADITASAYAWSTTEASNSPSGSTSIGTGLDDNLRAIQAGVAVYAALVPHVENASLAFSVGSSALTIALKTKAATDPSSTDKVVVPFRNVTAATGDYTSVTVSAATSLVISSGSTLGTANSTAFRLWIVAFNDGGTLRLGAINCLSGTSIYPLGGWGIASATDEGGAGGADSAHVFYAGATVTSKAYAVLGYATWESGLGTAGTWSAGPTRAQLFHPGTALPGDVVQVAENFDAAVATGTTDFPLDDTIPQSGEGDEFMDQAITPTSAANKLVIEHRGNYAHSGTIANFGLALFQDATANAIAAQYVGRDGQANARTNVSTSYAMRAGTTSSTTFKIRAGEPTGSGGTLTFNGAAGAREFGGAMYSLLRVTEVMA